MGAERSQRGQDFKFTEHNGLYIAETKELEPLPYLSYGSTPSRLTHKISEIMEHTAARDKACVHPFNAFPYEYYEGGILGRQKSLDACCRLIDICGEFAIFGISEGTLIELDYVRQQNALRQYQKPIEVFVKEFDPEWEKYHELFSDRFSDALNLIALK